ncbi:hypothetical protein CASFOL_038741 [Castilleja foliolosa]|uniref:Uncharacterized protein n=1 Tax=Castilleja foliolosa TaxID=1961234 RepID=A0ABD3BLU0_9LAMI
MADIYRGSSEIGRSENGEISRRDIQAAIAKTVELRALHTALMAGDSPANLRFSSAAASPVSRHARNLSAQEYPVFTPDFQKIKSHGGVIAGEIALPFRYTEIPLKDASPQDLNMINIAIGREEQADCASGDWTSQLSVNLQHFVNVKKSSLSKNVQHLLNLGGLFCDDASPISNTSDCPMDILGTDHKYPDKEDQNNTGVCAVEGRIGNSSDDSDTVGSTSDENRINWAAESQILLREDDMVNESAIECEICNQLTENDGVSRKFSLSSCSDDDDPPPSKCDEQTDEASSESNPKTINKTKREENPSQSAGQFNLASFILSPCEG